MPISPSAINSAAARLERERRQFPIWLPKVTPHFTWTWAHLQVIQQHLDRVTSGEIDRLMLFLPPRHGKSEMTTIRYPVWRLERDPSMRIIVAAYGHSLASKFTRKARGIAAERLELSSERAAADDWETTKDGGVRACGVGGSVTGMGGHLIVIDDPVKSREEANSEVYREKVWDWYTDDLYTRLEPGGAIILIMTRWHEDDLAGRILASEEADQWTVVSLPAFAEENDPLGRAVGDALCPERFPVEALNRIRTSQGRSFYALYQQRPQPLEGSMFKRSWFKLHKAVPTRNHFSAFVRYWDKAGTADGGTYSVGVLMGKHIRGDFWVLDVERGQWAAAEREKMIVQTAHLDRAKWGELVVTWIEQEPGSGGKESADATIQRLAGFRVRKDRVTGDKVIRAEPYAAQAEAGNVQLILADWTPGYLGELTSFPMGTYADQVDGSSGALNKLSRAKKHRTGSVKYA